MFDSASAFAKMGQHPRLRQGQAQSFAMQLEIVGKLLTGRSEPTIEPERRHGFLAMLRGYGGCCFQCGVFKADFIAPLREKPCIKILSRASA